MQPPYKSLLIDMLAAPPQGLPSLADDDYLQGDIEWYQYPFPQGQAGFAKLKLQGGIIFHHTRIQMESDGSKEEFIEYCRAKVDFTEPVLQIQCTLSGQIVRKDLETGIDYLTDEHHAYVCVAPTARFVTAVSPSVPTETVYLTVGVSTLNELLGADCAEQLCCKIDASYSRTHDLGRACLSPLKYCLDADLPFSIRKLQTYSRVLEFLGNLTMFYLSGDFDRGHTINNRVTADNIRRYIRRHYRNRMTLADLSKAFGVSARTLNNVLRQDTGMPAARLMREQRLALAHELIQQTDIALVELSDRLGYRHLSNFSAAFKKVFGYPPNALRLTGRPLAPGLKNRLQPPD